MYLPFNSSAKPLWTSIWVGRTCMWKQAEELALETTMSGAEGQREMVRKMVDGIEDGSMENVDQLCVDS